MRHLLAPVLGRPHLGRAERRTCRDVGHVAKRARQHGQCCLEVCVVDKERQEVGEALAPHGAPHAIVRERRERERLHRRVDVVDLVRAWVGGEADRESKELTAAALLIEGTDGHLGVVACELVRVGRELQEARVLPLPHAGRRQRRPREVLCKHAAPEHAILAASSKVAAGARERTHVTLTAQALHQDDQRVVVEQCKGSCIRFVGRVRPDHLGGVGRRC
mmetsp:Transcript_79915/g.158837  ORF Transcript_79915/g.158837 Transcript_79915/m.158837 type:complete len:220 (+) Transcript_79915:1189-1848(+)